MSNHNLLSCILHIQDTIQLNSYRDYIAYRDADSTKQITATLCYTANQAISQSGSTTKTNQFTYCIIPFSTTPNAQ